MDALGSTMDFSSPGINFQHRFVVISIWEHVFIYSVYVQRESISSFLSPLSLRPGFPGFPGFPAEPELKDGDQFEDPPPSSPSAASPPSSLGVTPPGEAPSPIINVFGSGSSMVTAATNEHPPTLLPASAKPQVTPTKLFQGWVWGWGWGGGGPHYCCSAAANLLSHLRKGDSRPEIAAREKNLLQQSGLADSWSQRV